MKKILSTAFVALGALALAACSPTTSAGDPNTNTTGGGNTSNTATPSVAVPTNFLIDVTITDEDVTYEEWKTAFDATDPAAALEKVTKFTYETWEVEGYEEEYDITHLDITDPTSYYVYELDREIDRNEVEEEEFLLTKNDQGVYTSYEVERKGRSVDSLVIEEVERDKHDDGKINSEVRENLEEIKYKSVRNPYHLKTGLYTENLNVKYYFIEGGFAFEATFTDVDDDDDDFDDYGNVNYTIYITYNSDGLLTSIALSEEHENSNYSEYEEKIITYNANFERKTSLVTQ